MRGLKRLRSARAICAGHAFVQDLRRGHYELALDLARTTDSPQSSPNSPAPSEQHIGPLLTVSALLLMQQRP
jgi:hypothetical protein